MEPAAPDMNPVSYGDEISEVMKKLNGDRTLSMLQQQALLQLKENPDFKRRVQDLVLNSDTLKRGLSGNMLLASLKEELEKTLVDEATLKLWEVICSREDGIATLLEVCVQAAHKEVLIQGIPAQITQR